MKKKECHMIPEEEKKCIWMTTGLISYKLCTRDFRCEECIFDQVMRNEMTVQNIQPSSEPAAAYAKPHNEISPRAKAALFYHQK
ncbi:MAG: hypothetical protein WCQ99_15695, partial [Pseudomonadota bacterium]